MTVEEKAKEVAETVLDLLHDYALDPEVQYFTLEALLERLQDELDGLEEDLEDEED